MKKVTTQIPHGKALAGDPASCDAKVSHCKWIYKIKSLDKSIAVQTDSQNGGVAVAVSISNLCLQRLSLKCYKMQFFER